VKPSLWKTVAVAIAIVAALGGAAGLLRSAPNADAQTATFVAGESVAVDTDLLNFRADPGLSGTIVDVLPFGTTGTIVAGPQDLDGYTWYGLDNNGQTGWVAGEYLAPIQNVSVCAVGATLVVNTDALNFRAESGLDAEIVDVIPTGGTVTVTGSPVEADGYVWYPVTYLSESGWVAGEYLADTATAGVGGVTSTGTTVMVAVDELNFRAGPSLADDVITTLPYGTVGAVVGSPVDADGYTWMEIDADGQTGWVAADFVQAA
jgi:uncharacterized protein YgiM (DUF1202 family)